MRFGSTSWLPSAKPWWQSNCLTARWIFRAADSCNTELGTIFIYAGHVSQNNAYEFKHERYGLACPWTCHVALQYVTSGMRHDVHMCFTDPKDWQVRPVHDHCSQWSTPQVGRDQLCRVRLPLCTLLACNCVHAPAIW